MHWKFLSSREWDIWGSVPTWSLGPQMVSGVPCPWKGHCCQWLTAALLPHVAAQHSGLLLPCLPQCPGKPGGTLGAADITARPTYKPLHQQKTGGRNAGQGDCEPQEAVMSPTSTPGSGSMSDGPENLLNWLLLKTSSLQKLQHWERKSSAGLWSS